MFQEAGTSEEGDFRLQAMTVGPPRQNAVPSEVDLLVRSRSMDRLMVGVVLRQNILFLEKAVKLLAVSLMLVLLIGSTACGGGQKSASASGDLSGNWQISLVPQAPPPTPSLVLTGFMLQTSSVTGALIMGTGASGVNKPLALCPGVGPVTGAVDNSNVSLSVNGLGQEVSLKGTSSPLAGQFSYPSGGCASSPDTGTWSAVPVQPLTGSFQGTFTSVAYTSPNAVLGVTGTLTQGPNTGDSTALITGTIQATGAHNFCPYLSQATVSGFISGTTVVLNFYGPNGDLITQLGQLGQLNNTNVVPSPGVCNQYTNPNSPPSQTSACLLVTPDAKSVSGNYSFPQISSACTGDWGSVQFTFSSGQNLKIEP